LRVTAQASICKISGSATHLAIYYTGVLSSCIHVH